MIRTARSSVNAASRLRFRHYPSALETTVWINSTQASATLAIRNPLWNHYNLVFSFAFVLRLAYFQGASIFCSRWTMIICSCNVLSDHDVRTAVATAPASLRSTSQVYNCLGCSAQCGRCARTIRRIMEAALQCNADCTGCSRADRHRE
jgi:bacterioferritin-associated ferredoxin